MGKYNLTFITLLFLINSLFSQNERIAAIGNPSIAIRDFDMDLNLYDFGRNVAGLSEDRTFDILFIKPKFNSFNGNYRRYFDYEKSNLYGLTFDGTKILKEGSFRGYVTYEIERRKNVNRALNRYPYTGIPFFIADTTTGDFVYNGPKVGFQYSFELLKNLFMGFELNYQLVDGLKDVYSRAKSLWRNIDGSYNLAYYFDKNFSIGVKISHLDNKESIEAKSEDLFDAEIFNFRGDNYAFKRRSQTVEQTYREKSNSYSLQSIFSPYENIKVGLKSEYRNSTLKTQYPYGMLKEYEEGHSVFERLFFNSKIHYSPFKSILIGFEVNYEKNESWSRISELALMIWKWNLEKYDLGSGLTYKFNSIPLIWVAETSIGKIISDSSKYIDNKYANNSKPFYVFKTGLEYEIIDRIFLRAGLQKNLLGFDQVRGGKDVSIYNFCFGAGLYSFKSFEIDFYVDYMITKKEKYSNNNINSQISVKLFKY